MTEEDQPKTYLAETKPSVESASAIAHALEAMANEAFQIFTNAPGRYRYDLHNKQGWLDLRESLWSRRLVESIPEPTRRQLDLLCVRWLHLHKHLTFISATKPVWNS